MTTESSTMNTVAQGGVAVTALAFLHSALTNMIPYAIIAIPLILLDLLWGIRAARFRKERVTFSHAFRRTMSKAFDYLCWIIIAASVAVAVDAKWLEWAILGMVMLNEIVSIIGNYFETKGIQLSFVDFFRWVFKKGAEKAGVGVTEDEAAAIIRPKQPRNAKGQFVSRKGHEEKGH